VAVFVATFRAEKAHGLRGAICAGDVLRPLADLLLLRRP
jgi:hypothetical protein